MSKSAHRELKVGMSLYRYYACMEELIITSIKRPNIKQKYSYYKTEYSVRVYATVKDEFTWVVKERKKVRDRDGKKSYVRGWAKNIDPAWKVDFDLEEYQEKGLPSPLAFTPEGAFVQAIRSAQNGLDRAIRNSYGQEEIDECRRDLSELERKKLAYKNKKERGRK